MCGKRVENDFSTFDTEIVMGQYDEKNSAHVRQLAAHLDLVPPANDPVRPYSGVVDVVNGQLDLTNITVLHNRSIAEDVQVARNGKSS